MNSKTTTTEDLEIPILSNKVSKSRKRCFPEKPPEDHRCLLTIGVIGVSALIVLVTYLVGGLDVVDYQKPEFRLDSVYVCPTNNSNNLVIWDLKVDITNTDNHTLCIPQFEVSVLSSNGLLAKAAVSPTHTCLGSASRHTSAQALVEDSLETNGTSIIRFDLKFHAHFLFTSDGQDFYDFSGDLVCKDANVAFSTPSCNSACGCMVGDPFLCSYESYKID